MAAAGGGGVEALQLEVAELRVRVQELEKENQRLAKIGSSCCCLSKAGNVASFAVAEASLEGSTQQEQQHSKFEETRTLEDIRGFPFDHLAPSAENEAQVARLELLGHCPKRLIALKIMYFGERFYGFASEAHAEPTVESEIFKALERTKLLVGSRKESCYSRCGRTDKGVSATGQVISLYLRSNIKEIGGDVLEEKHEIDYVKVLNRVLPRDIHVIGWCPVPANFNARFTCLNREYRYLFWKRDLDIPEMQKAASKFIGKHDFRNFCKMDAANVSNYRRHITDFNISAYEQRSNDDELWAMTIKGSAFLWHQVRCMVAILFLIGQGLESPNIVDSLLDISKTTRKPQYKMAPELPLILRSCQFNNVNFICSSDACQSLTEHLKNEYRHYMLQAAIFHEALSCLSFPEANSLAPHRKKRNHIPLLSRQTEPSYEERLAKFKTKPTDNLQ